MTPGIRAAISTHIKWLRTSDMLRFHQCREESKHYPEHLKGLKKNYMIKVLNEYM
jgi:hypothetical protein